MELAKVVVSVVENKTDQYKSLYRWNSPITYKIEILEEQKILP